MRNAGRSKTRANIAKRSLVVDVLKLIDEIAKLAFAVGNRDALDHAPEEEFGS
ncbi:hypothetical protein ACYCVF_30990 [Bradyrhizobium sp. 1.29L]